MKVRQILADEATVLVWKNEAEVKLLKGVGRFGHAAVMLRTRSLPPLAQTAVLESTKRGKELRKLKLDLVAARAKLGQQRGRLATSMKARDAASNPGIDQEMVAKLKQRCMARMKGEDYAQFAANKSENVDDLVNAWGDAFADAYPELAGEVFAVWTEWMKKRNPAKSKELDREVDALKVVVADIEAKTKALEGKLKLWKGIEEQTKAWSYLDEGIEDNYCFISWWPGDEGVGGNTAKENIRSMRAQQGGARSDNWKEDMRDELGGRARDRLQAGSPARPGQVQIAPGDWGHEPEFVLNVPAVGPANQYWGVSTERAWAWFDDFVDNGDATYKMISGERSCSGVAALALKAGGGEAFHAAPAARIYMLPNSVAAWAKQLAMEISALNNHGRGFELRNLRQGRELAEENFGADALFADDLWSVHEWKEHSSKSMSIRRGRIATIDSALRDYHALDWDADDFPARYGKLVKIFRECMMVVQSESYTYRNGAVWALGMQCLHVRRQEIKG
ncbi:MAG TPA: hypothetical protein VH277_00485 [Gemmatimonadaceae bacterium]|nr:hypothetical protein [Gemmatimonadaceae bacterium]